MSFMGGDESPGFEKGVDIPKPKELPKAPELPKAVTQPKLAKAEKVPTTAEMNAFIDEIAGVQFIKVKGPNGKESLIRKKLPKTAQEETFAKMGEDILNRAMSGIRQLDQYDPSKVAKFEPFINTMANLDKERVQDLSGVFSFKDIERDINDFRQIQSRNLEKDIIRNRHQLEHSLNQRGIGDTAYGMAQKEKLQQSINNARDESELRAREYGRGVERHQLSQNIAGYNLREEARRSQLGTAQTEYGLNRQQLGDVEAIRQQALQERYNQFKLGSGLRSEEANLAMMSRAPELALGNQQAMNAQNVEAYNMRNKNRMTGHEAERERLNTGYNQEFQRANQGFENEFKRENTMYQNELAYAQAQNENNRENFKVQQAAEAAKGPGMGEMLGGLAGSALGMVGGGVMMGPAGSGGAMLAGKLFGGK